MPFAAALSEHPIAAHAVGEVVGELLERLGPAPDLVVVFAAASHTGTMEDVAAAFRELLDPGALVGCTAAMVAGGSREVEGRPALSAWAARGVTATTHRLTHLSPAPDLDGADALLVLADPYTFAPAATLDGAGAVPVVGGMASAARSPGGNRLVLDGEIVRDGAVAAAIRGAQVATVVSQGCRPVGDPMTITKGEGSVIGELAGRPALERVQEVLGGLNPDDLALAGAGLHLGRVIDEHKTIFGRGDFLVRTILGADPATGAVAVDDEVEIGGIVQLHIRDALTADEDLHALLRGQLAGGALLFSCNGRGTPLFAAEDHDARVVRDLLGDIALAGMSCAGELGPVGGRSFVHGFTASILLLDDRDDGQGARPRSLGLPGDDGP